MVIQSTANSWLKTEKIDIGDYENISVNATISYPYSTIYPGDSVCVYYQINEGPEILFSKNGKLFHNFLPTIAQQENLSGQYITIIIRATAYNTYYFDDISVFGKRKVVFSNDTLIKIKPLVSTTYYLKNKIWDCTQDSVTIKVFNARPLATVFPKGSTSICSGDSIKLKANSDPTFSYIWFRNDTVVFGAIDSIYYAKKQGIYYVKVSNACGSDSSSQAILKLTPCSNVWPGDANHDSIVNNNDLLQVGLHYSQTGSPRASMSNNWQAYIATNWGAIQTNGADIKHIDCNGDGVINKKDTLAINLNFNLTHTIVESTNIQQRQTTSDLYFLTSSNPYNSSNFVDVEIWLGTVAKPVNNLYGIAFNINYNASLVQSGSESLIYPVSWLGAPGTNAIKIAKIDALATTAYGAETRIDHINANGYGKIADLKFQLKNSIPVNTKMFFSFSNYKANDSIGVPVFFNTKIDSILINPLVNEIKETNNIAVITIYPNPYSNNTTIAYTLTQKSGVSVEVYNTVGQKVETLINANQGAGEYKCIFSAKEKGYGAGVYFVKIIVDGNTTMRRIVEMK